MFYAIIAEDREDSLEQRIKARPGHLKRLEALQSDGRLLLAGPHPAIDAEDPGPNGFTGSLIVAEFPDQQSAQSWADADPYAEAGVYARVTIKPFKKVFPA